EKLLALPKPALEDQFADTRMVARADHDPAAPMPAAGNGLHARSIDVHPARLIAVPLPGGGTAKRGHDMAIEHLRQRLLEDAEQAQAETVHAHIVVFEVGAGRAERALCALVLVPGRGIGTGITVPVDGIRALEKFAEPLTGLFQ